MVRVNLICPCPICEDDTRCWTWFHTRCGGRLTLDNNAIVRCERCDLEEYIFRLKFYCHLTRDGKHKGGRENLSLQGLLNCLAILGKWQNPPANFIVEVTNAIMAHQDEFDY